MNDETAIGISYQNDIPHEFIQDFQTVIEDAGIPIESHARGQGVYAAFEWAIPTVIIVYLAKPFFEAFLSEAGKDAYTAFKRGSLLLVRKLFGQNSAAREQRRSLLFSIQLQDRNGRSIKCIIPEGLCHEEYSNMFDDLYDLLADDFNSNEDSRLNKMLKNTADFGRVFYIEYSSTSKDWIAIDTKAEIQSRNKAD